MTGVKPICAGKLKEDFYLKACQEYQKRLSAFCRLEAVEIPEDTRPGGLEREGDKILAAIPPQSYVVAMCIEGEEMSSRELSRKMEKWQSSGISRLALYHRLFRGPFGQGERKSRAAPVHVPYDLSLPFGPGDGAGADLPGFFHRRRKQISQIITPLFLVFFREKGDFLHLIHFIEKNDWKAYALFDIII